MDSSQDLKLFHQTQMSLFVEEILLIQNKTRVLNEVYYG